MNNVHSSRVRQGLIILCFMMSSGLVDASPKIESIAMASPNIIEVVVHTGEVRVGRQVPYVKQAEDVVKEIAHNRTLIRGGHRVGVLIGSDMLRPFDTFSGDLLDATWADSKASYWIESATHSHYQQRVHPVGVFRKSRPTGVARTDNWKFRTPIESHLYLVLPHPLKPEASYEISFGGNQFPRQRFKYQPLSMRSESVHVSHIGFHPDD
ncbi:MAG: hypothetical protein HQ515_13825, partial [Phycisphaeraceae bacterium]|nr:hypothetical protein [Phycisphaeraceae bacterium]